ncbi:MAG: TonB-dependent receptor plug domain-containing protein [Glaciecola sp.]|jgi:vitamin B12 transporter|nr:TonB-dependent receptor [Glaciecola sp.]
MTFHKYALRAAISGALSCALLMTTVAHAQNTNEPLETIVVSGSHSAMSIAQLAGNVSVMTAAEIANSQAAFVSELLVQFAGVDISTNGGVGQFAELRLRGSETNHILVLLDGIAINDQGQGGLVDLAHLSTQNIARIELYRGAQSALWGDGAVGGVLNIITQSGADNDTTTHSLKAGLGTKNTQQLHYQQQGQFTDGHYGLTVSRQQTDGQNISIVDGNTEKDGYQNTSMSAQLGYVVNHEHTVSAVLHNIDYLTMFDATDFVTTGLPVDADNVTDGRQQSAALRWAFTPTGITSNRYSYTLDSSAKYHRNFVENTSSGALSGLTDAKTVSLRSVARLASNNGLTRQYHIGLSADKTDFEQRGPSGFGDPNQSQRIESHSIFGDAVIALSDNIYTNSSIRYTDNSEFDAAIDYRIGANYQSSDKLTWFASIGRASKNPSFTERFGFFAGTFQGNPNLKPEQSSNIEIGLRSKYVLANSQLNQQINVFVGKLENEINGFVYDAQTGNFTSDNVAGTSDRSGIEWELSWISADVSINASYSYLDASQGDEETVELRRARHNGSINMSYTVTPTMSTYVSASYVGSKSDQFFPPYPEPSKIIGLRAYWLVNANLTYQISSALNVSAKVDNLFDHGYQDIVGYRGLERKAMLAVKYQW